jgi:hypothetical protein
LHDEHVTNWGSAVKIFSQQFPDPDAEKAQLARYALIAGAELDGVKTQVELALQAKPTHERTPSEKALESIRLKLQRMGTSRDDEQADRLFTRDFGVISGSFVPSYTEMYQKIDEIPNQRSVPSA